MNMILLDWTRMGGRYCLAGVVVEGSGVRVVRPMLVRGRGTNDRRSGWPAAALRGHRRWDMFELVGAELAATEPPHVEDHWVRTLRPLGRSASVNERRAFLEATTAPSGQPLFGTPLASTRASAF